MGAGQSDLYKGTYGDKIENVLENAKKGKLPINGEDYNPNKSESVGKVDTINTEDNAHNMPTTSDPNSVTRNYRDGKLDSERYYGDDGKPYLDIDYTDHGNSKMHPVVPHEHKIVLSDAGEIIRH